MQKLKYILIGFIIGLAVSLLMILAFMPDYKSHANIICNQVDTVEREAIQP